MSFLCFWQIAQYEMRLLQIKDLNIVFQTSDGTQSRMGQLWEMNNVPLAQPIRLRFWKKNLHVFLVENYVTHFEICP